MIGPECPPSPVAGVAVILAALVYAALFLLFIFGGFDA